MIREIYNLKIHIGRHNEILLSTIKVRCPFLDEFIDLKTSNIIGLDKSDMY